MSFDDIISSMLAEGMSIEDIASQMSATLNKKQKEVELEKKKEKARDDRYDGLFDNLVASVDTGEVDFKTAASAATAYVLEEHSDWDIQTLDLFYQEALQMLEGLEEIYVKRQQGDPVIQMFDKIFAAFGKEQPEPIGAPHKGQEGSTKSEGLGDKAKIKQWIKDMGW